MRDMHIHTAIPPTLCTMYSGLCANGYAAIYALHDRGLFLTAFISCHRRLRELQAESMIAYVMSPHHAFRRCRSSHGGVVMPERMDA